MQLPIILTLVQSLLFVEHAKYNLSPGLLHSLSPLPEMLLPQITTWLILSSLKFPSKCPLFVQSFSEKSILKKQTQTCHPVSYCALFLFSICHN